MEMSQKVKNRTTIWSSNSTPGYLSKENKKINSKRYMHPYMFTAAWSTLAKVSKQPKCPSTHEWIKKIWYTYTMEEEMATYSSTLAWKIPWTEKRGRPQPTGSHRVGHHWATHTFTFQFSAAVFSHPVVSDSLRPHGLQHTSPPCPSPSPGVCPSSCSLHPWGRPAISSSDALFSFCPQSFPALGTFLMSCLFTPDEQNIRASASAAILSVNI